VYHNACLSKREGREEREQPGPAIVPGNQHRANREQLLVLRPTVFHLKLTVRLQVHPELSKALHLD
jgi:hypothetical protein